MHKPLLYLSDLLPLLSASLLYLLTLPLSPCSLGSSHSGFFLIPQMYNSSILSQVQRLFVQALLKSQPHGEAILDYTDG